MSCGQTMPLIQVLKLTELPIFNTYTMIRKLFTLTLVLAGLNLSAQTVGPITDPVEWVNPLMGTQSKPELSNGNTYPAIGLPWGMNLWTAQTGKMGNGWAYQYDADKIRGFKQTHQPSPWMNDYGAFAMMPVTGKLKFTEDERASWFSHKAEIAKPYYYSVYLADANVTTEITPTERAAQFRFTFPKTDSAFIVVDALNKGSYIKIIPAERKIIGYTTRYARGPLPSNFKNYFVIYFDKAFTLAKTWSGTTLNHNELSLESDHTGAVIGFKTNTGEKVTAKVASSFISFEQAEISLKRELANDAFDVTKSKAKAIWNKTLARVAVEGGTPAQTQTFYSSLYRTLFFPISYMKLMRTIKLYIGAPITERYCRVICLPVLVFGIRLGPCTHF